MADDVSLSFLSSFSHNSCYNMVYLWFQNSYKMNIVDIYTLYWGNKAAGKQISQLLASEVGDSQQWRISPNNGRLDFTRCRRSNNWVTYIGWNDFKIIMYIEETSLYEIILSVTINVSLVYCSGTPKLAKLPQGWQFSLVYSLTAVTKLKFLVTFNDLNQFRIIL